MMKMLEQKHAGRWLRRVLAAAACVAWLTPAQAEEEISVAEKVVRIDAGRKWFRQRDVVRVGALLKQMADRYSMTELRVADVSVKVREILLEKYGVESKIQAILEDLNRISPRIKTEAALQVLAMAYVELRNAGMDGREAVAAINAEILAAVQ